MLDWLEDIGYEQNLYDSEDSETVAAARWSNVLEFCDWMAQRAGGQIEDAAGTTTQHRSQEPAGGGAEHRPAVHHLRARSEQDQVALSTLHASKGLEWPHVQLVGRHRRHAALQAGHDDGKQQKVSDDIAARLQEERRLMYVGITRAQRTLAVSWTESARKKGREMVQCQPSRFIAEMKLDPAADQKSAREGFANNEMKWQLAFLHFTYVYCLDL